MAEDTSDVRKAVDDLIRSIDNVFKKYGRTARRRAWNSILSSQGKAYIDTLVNSPNRPITGTWRIASFKEWLVQQTEILDQIEESSH